MLLSLYVTLTYIIAFFLHSYLYGCDIETCLSQTNSYYVKIFWVSIIVMINFKSESVDAIVMMMIIIIIILHFVCLSQICTHTLSVANHAMEFAGLCI